MIDPSAAVNPHVANFIDAMECEGIDPYPILIEAEVPPKWFRRRGTRHLVPDTAGWVFAVLPAVGEGDRVHIAALTDGKLVRVFVPFDPALSPESVTLLGSRVPVVSSGTDSVPLSADDPDAAFRVERVKEFGAMHVRRYGGNPIDPTALERVHARRKGFASLEGYRAWLDGAPREWALAYDGAVTE